MTSDAFVLPHVLTAPDSAAVVPIDALIAANSTVIYNVCLRLLRDPCAAEDACQETMIAAWRHCSEAGLGRTWLLHVALNKCRDEMRRRARRPTVAFYFNESDADVCSSLPEPEAMALHTDACRDIERALMQLSWPQRLALVLGDVEGWSYREIAGMTGASIGTVKSRIFRARIRLRALLAQGSTV